MFIKVLSGEIFEAVKQCIVSAVINRQISDARTGRKVECSNLVLESKMAELNQNKKSKQADWADAV